MTGDVRAECPRCHATPKVRADGRLYGHYDPDKPAATNRRARVCPGSYAKPKAVTPR